LENKKKKKKKIKGDRGLLLAVRFYHIDLLSKHPPPTLFIHDFLDKN
jgi:hypothetical protein